MVAAHRIGCRPGWTPSSCTGCSGRKADRPTTSTGSRFRSRSGWRGCAVDRLVYDCIDPGLPRGGPGGRSTRASSPWRPRHDVVFCTAETLLERMQDACTPMPTCLNNAASPEMYESERSGTQDCRRHWPGGLTRSSATWAPPTGASTARRSPRRPQALPDYTFCIAGRVNADQEPRVTELRALPNVVMPGAVSTRGGCVPTTTPSTWVSSLSYRASVGDADQPRQDVHVPPHGQAGRLHVAQRVSAGSSLTSGRRKTPRGVHRRRCATPWTSPTSGRTGERISFAQAEHLGGPRPGRPSPCCSPGVCCDDLRPASPRTT